MQTTRYTMSPPVASHLDYNGTKYENLLASCVSPLASFSLGAPRNRTASDILFGDAAYSSRKNIAACARAGMVPGIMHTINVTARDKGSGDAWGVSVR